MGRWVYAKSLFVFVVFSYWVVFFFFFFFLLFLLLFFVLFFVCLCRVFFFFNVLRFRYIRKNMISTNCSDIRSIF